MTPLYNILDPPLVTIVLAFIIVTQSVSVYCAKCSKWSKVMGWSCWMLVILFDHLSSTLLTWFLLSKLLLMYIIQSWRWYSEYTDVHNLYINMYIHVYKVDYKNVQDSQHLNFLEYLGFLIHKCTCTEYFFI